SAWPGESCTYLGNNIWKWEYNGDMRIPEDAGIIFNNGSAQTADFTWVNGGLYTLDGYSRTIEGAGEIPDTPDTPEPEDTKWTIYFRGDNGWNPVYAYVWDRGDNDRQILGAWPGSTMSMTTLNNMPVWSISFTATPKSPMVIFNNGNGGNGNQTADLVLVNNAVYGADGTTSITAVTAEDALNAYASGGNLIIESCRDRSVAIYAADGTVRIVNVAEGVNVIDTLPHGFYIVAGKKIIL
ncbi:MAG: starch-binding protein, partial [Muribaculum sp.]|nr:starch-binding protein [Muribaculum sp.]